MIRPVAVALVVLTARAASADTCDRRSGTADLVVGVLDAIASSGNGSSSSGSSQAGPAASACLDASGEYVDCDELHGARSHADVTVELATAVRSFTSPLGSRTGTIQHDTESFSYRAVARDPSPDTAAVAQLRIARGLRYGLYAGGELEGGVVAGSDTAVEMTTTGERGTPAIEQTGVATYGGLAVAGIAGRVGPLDLGVETAGGVRVLSYRFRSTYGACISNVGVSAAMPVLEGRARAAVWVHPSVAVGATYGKSLLDDAWLGGLYVHWSTHRR